MGTERIELDWEQFKDFLDTRGVSPQVIPGDKLYLIRAADNFFSVGVKLRAENMADTSDPNYKANDQVAIDDFNTNYLAISNSTPMETFIRHLGEDHISVSPRTLSFDNEGNFDKELSSSTGLLSIRGGVAFIDKVDWALGDKIGITIVDKNNVLGLGGTPANPKLVSTFIPDGEWCLMPDIANELIDEAISSPIPDGLFLRLKVTKGGSNTPKGILNIYAYEV